MIGMEGLTAAEQEVVERAGAEPTLEQVLGWCAVNSGSHNLDGLGAMAGLLSDEFSALPGELQLLDRSPLFGFPGGADPVDHLGGGEGGCRGHGPILDGWADTFDTLFETVGKPFSAHLDLSHSGRVR